MAIEIAGKPAIVWNPTVGVVHDEQDVDSLWVPGEVAGKQEEQELWVRGVLDDQSVKPDVIASPPFHFGGYSRATMPRPAWMSMDAKS